MVLFVVVAVVVVDDNCVLVNVVVVDVGLVFENLEKVHRLKKCNIN
jgi:hypothetical protein